MWIVLEKLFFTFFLLFLLTSCSHLQSGHYIHWRKGDTVEVISKKFSVPKMVLIHANRGKDFVPGEWIFIPLKRGIIGSETLSMYFAGSDMNKRDFYGTPLLWPVPNSHKVSSPFGRRRRKHMHKGIDIAAPHGSPIVASDDGVVTYSGNRLRGFGNIVILRHRGPLRTVYAHASKLLVHKGERVFRGQIIALVGNTGRSSGAHLHYEVREHKRPINPIPLIKRRRR